MAPARDQTVGDQDGAPARAAESGPRSGAKRRAPGLTSRPHGRGVFQILDEAGATRLIRQYDLASRADAAYLRELFDRECQVLQHLRHPHLPLVAEADSGGDVLRLVLESPLSTSLWALLYPDAPPADGTPKVAAAAPTLLSAGFAVRWVVQLARALAYLHRQVPYPLLHHGISPFTVGVTRGGIRSVQLLDFGRPRSFFTAGRESEDDQVAAADRFADPRPFSSTRDDPRRDVYAFGRVVDFILTGSVPPDPAASPAAAVAADILISRDERLAPLLDVLGRCCTADPQDRYESMTRVLDALLEALASGDGAASALTCVCGEHNPEAKRFCRRCGRGLRSAPVAIGPATALGKNGSAHWGSGSVVPITYDQDSHTALSSAMERGQAASLERFRLREALDGVQSTPGFDELITLDSLSGLLVLPHQRQTALTALRQMRGRALLADEVGLGKTIEAGIILKELARRGLVNRVLILCPVQLLGQWQSELYEKFGEIFLVMGRDVDTSLAWHCPRLIAPYEVAGQRFHIEEMRIHTYDLVILDEAHYLNQEENLRVLETVRNLQKKYFLLLSATPMHNSLDELYKIVTLLRPGHFADLATFQAQYVDPDNPTRARNVDQLRDLLHQIMVRHTRQQVAAETQFPRRTAETVLLELEPRARAFYDEFRRFYQASLQRAGNRRFVMQMCEVPERLCSSRGAFREGVNRLRRERRVVDELGPDFLAELERFEADYPPSLTEPKVLQSLEVAAEYVRGGEKILVFSQYNETARSLFERAKSVAALAAAALLYDEQASYDQRLQGLRDFRDWPGGAVLFCPGEASEGLNLQFARTMVNVDIPWDPMKLEQRIGRIQRIGGAGDVHVFNLVLRGTIEEEILAICEQKIGMFEAVVGKVEEILGNLREEDDFRALVCNLFLDRHEQTEDGADVDPRSHLDAVLTEAADKASGEDESNNLNEIFFDASPDLDDAPLDAGF